MREKKRAREKRARGARATAAAHDANGPRSTGGLTTRAQAAAPDDGRPTNLRPRARASPPYSGAALLLYIYIGINCTCSIPMCIIRRARGCVEPAADYYSDTGADC